MEGDRAKVLRYLVVTDTAQPSIESIEQHLGRHPDDVEELLKAMEDDGLVWNSEDCWGLTMAGAKAFNGVER